RGGLRRRRRLRSGCVARHGRGRSRAGTCGRRRPRVEPHPPARVPPRHRDPVGNARGLSGRWPSAGDRRRRGPVGTRRGGDRGPAAAPAAATAYRRRSPPVTHRHSESLWGTPEVSAVDGRAQVIVDGEDLSARAAAVIEDRPLHLPQLPAPDDVADKVHTDTRPDGRLGEHVLVVGGSEKAALVALELSDEGANVVLARANASANRLSRLTRSAVLLREAERRLTVLWHSRPLAITSIDTEPLVTFDDVRTPDLLFDHVVLVDDASV